MKPTVSYVRGLRDILEIDSREDRRAYIRGRYLIENILVCSTGASLALASISTLLSEPAPHRVLTVVTMYSLSLIPMGVSLFTGVRKGNIDKRLEKVARAYQDNLRNKAKVPRGLEKDLF